MTRTYQNPVYPDYFADPFVWRCGAEYYAIGTGLNEAVGRVSEAQAPSVFPLLRSKNLFEWAPAGFALQALDTSLGDSYWAPEVACAEGKWFLYYSVGHGDRLHQLRVAQANDPLGPYIDVTGLTSLQECAFAIDPHPFRDDDGLWYLFHARDFLDAGEEYSQSGGVRVGTALVVQRLESMTKLSTEWRTVARARCDWQRFAANRAMYDGVYDWHTLEGPFVVKHDARYYCFYSGGCWQTDTYGVDYVTADTVLGPYSDAGAEQGPRVLRTVPGRVIGPGHCSIVRDAEDALYLAYHAWDADLSARRPCIDALHFTAQGPRSRATWTEQHLRVAACA